MNLNRTLVIIKPDAVQRGLSGEIIDRFLKKGFTISKMKMISIDETLARNHYIEHENKGFFKDLVSFITSGPSIVIIFEGNNVQELARKMIGATDPKNADLGTIRGDYGNSIDANLVHASDSEESAKREESIFFGGGI
jgi:nucleoside-diphosphate kinase